MTPRLFDRVAIIGFGLIGSSLARALSENDLAGEIVCGDISAEVCAVVLELGLAAKATIDLAEAVRDCSLIVICTPIGTYAQIGRTIASTLAPGAIVTDVGSVKQAVVASLAPVLPAHARFVPGHPIAGGEKSGRGPVLPPFSGNAGVSSRPMRTRMAKRCNWCSGCGKAAG